MGCCISSKNSQKDPIKLVNKAPEDKKSQSPDPKVVIEIDLKLAKAAM